MPRGQKRVLLGRSLPIFLFLYIIFTPFFARAEFSFTASPVDGSSSIRFPALTTEPVNVEVRVRINSDQGKRYELRQKVLEDFRNDQGENLSGQGISFYTLNGSNTRGTLYQTSPMAIDTMDRVLYASSGQGDADSFIIVYQVDPNNINASGNFFSRILYTLQPLEGGVSQQNNILNCYLTVERKSSFSISTSSHGTHALRLEKSQNGYDGHVEIKLDRSLGRQFQITQLVEELFISDSGQTIPLEKFSLSLNAQKGQYLLPSFSALSQKPTQLYLSTNSGEADDLTINYHIDKDVLGGFSSGMFRARFVYTVESGTNILARLPLDMQLEVIPVFEIEIPADFKGGLFFQNIQPGVTMEREIVLRVNSNMQRPYAVVQRVTLPLTNESGNSIPLSFFKFKSEDTNDTTGQTVISESQEVHLGDTTIFISDAQGSSSSFILRYFLEGPRDVKSGDYFAKISYALVEK